MNWTKFLAGILYSLLPRNLWRGWTYDSPTGFSRSTIVSGAVECALGTYFGVARYFPFLLFRAKQLRVVGNEGTQLYMTGVLTAEYLLQPLTILLAFLSVEGFIRAMAAFIHEEALPSAPFKLFELLQRSVSSRIRRRREGPCLPDQVEQIVEPVPEIRIATSHPKEGWRKGITVEVRAEFYDIHETLPGAAPYRVVYVLRKKPLGTSMRGRYLYEI